MRLSKLFKAIGGSAFAGAVASGLIGLYIRLVTATMRRRDINREALGDIVEKPGGLLVAFWHHRLLLAASLRKETDRKVYMLVSANRDGDIIADAVKPFGIEMIRGSSANPKKKAKDKGGAPALAQMIAALKEGHVVGVTPDGPRGPRGRAQAGPIRLAQLSGAPIVPVAYSASSGPFLKRAWDRFLLPLPFSRTAFAVSEPIRVPRDAGPEALEAARRTLEDALTGAARLVDTAVGRSPDDAGLARIEE